MARKGQRAIAGRGVTPKTVEKHPKEWDEEKTNLQRKYLMVQMVAFFLISFFLLELFVKTGSQSLMQIGLSGLFFISGIFLFIVFVAVHIGRPWKIAPWKAALWSVVLWWVGVLGIALFIVSVTQIVSAMKEILDLLGTDSPLYQPVLGCGIAVAYLVVAAQAATSIFSIQAAYPKAKKSQLK